MRLFTEHKNWWSSLTSTFIGSLLGIGITFGLSDFIQERQQREMTRKLLITSVAQIETRCDKIGEKCEEFSQIDSLFTILLCCKLYSEEKVKLPQKWLEVYAEYISLGSSLTEENWLNSMATSVMNSPLIHVDSRRDETQMLLSNNVEVLNVLHDLSVVDDIKSVHFWLDKVDTLVAETDKYYKRLQSVFRESKAFEFNWEKKELQQSDQFIENISKEVEKNLEEFAVNSFLYFFHSKSLQSIYRHLVDESLPFIKEELHVTSEEINSIKSNMASKLDSVYQEAFEDGLKSANLVFDESRLNSYKQLIIDTTNVKK